MPVLSREQIDAFRRDGYLMVEDAMTPAQLAALNAEIASWVEASRGHVAPFGPPTIDGRPRFDMGAEHSAARPALRRRVELPKQPKSASSFTVLGQDSKQAAE